MFDAVSRRAFELFEDNGHTFGHEVEDWFKAEQEMFHPTHINVAETGESIEVRAELPGFNEKDLQVNVEPRRLTITGKRETSKEEKKGQIVYSQTCSDQVFRVVDLPAEVEAGKATATLKNGMLELTMPKAAKHQGIRIQPENAA